MSPFTLRAVAAFIALTVASNGPSFAETGADLLTLEEALALGLSDDPSTKAALAKHEAAEAGARQAQRSPNPTVDLVSENLMGTGPFRSADQAETTLSLSQTIEMGGDREARSAVAQQEAEAAGLDAQLTRLDLAHEIELAFVDAQAATVSLSVAQERLKLSKQLQSAIAQRVAAARDPIVASARAEAGIASAEADLERQQLEAEAARTRLASFWGGSLDFSLDLSSFGRVKPDVTPGDSVDLQRLKIEEDRARANVALEEARGVVDVRISGGVRRFEANDETALILGLSVPLPVWDDNSDAIARARSEQARAGYEVEAERRKRARSEANLKAVRDAAFAQAEALGKRVIPRGQDAVRRALDGYRSGGFSYLDVLEAQRALADYRQERIAALVQFHRAQAALVRLRSPLMPSSAEN